MHSSKAIGRRIANVVVNGFFEYCLDRERSALVHPVIQLEIPKREFSVSHLVPQRLTLWSVDGIAHRDLQMLKGLEPFALMRVIQRLAQGQVIQFFAIAHICCEPGQQQKSQQREGCSRHRSAVPDHDPVAVVPRLRKSDAQRLGSDIFRECVLGCFRKARAVAQVANHPHA